MRDRDFDPVAETFRDSLGYRATRTMVERGAAAARESAAFNRLRALEQSFAAQGVQHRIQIIAMTIAIASLAHLAIRDLLPRYATSGLPWWWNVTIAVFATIVATLPIPIAAASVDSAPAKLWRRLTA